MQRKRITLRHKNVMDQLGILPRFEGPIEQYFIERHEFAGNLKSKRELRIMGFVDVTTFQPFFFGE